MTVVLKKTADILKFRQEIQNKSVGFVPTMGALHLGHRRLLEIAREQNDIVVLSVFVNKTQFNDPKDFEHYPQTWDADLSIAESAKVDAVFGPDYPELYPDGYQYRLSENHLSKELCGRFRPGHFDGVLSVVMKLFQLIRPHRAYFGEKDYQQLQLIQGMVSAFFLPVTVVPVPTIREADGIAMSSRNRRLSPEHRKLAPLIYRSIQESKSADQVRMTLEASGFEVDYVEDRGDRRFIAAFLGGVRLIDNIKI